MYSFIKNTIQVVLELFGLGKAEIWAGRVTIFLLIVIPLLVIAFFANWISSCRSSNFQKKVDEAAATENKEKGAVEVEQENKNAAVNEAQNKGNIANEKANNFANITNTDSNQFNSNWSAVKRRFCASHPFDSACK